MALKLGIVGISAVWNLRGAVSVGQGSVRMMVVSLSPFVVLIGLAVWRGLQHGCGASRLRLGLPQGWILRGAVSVTLWNYMGWDNASTIAQEVDEPQRNYPRAMLMSTMT